MIPPGATCGAEVVKENEIRPMPSSLHFPLVSPRVSLLGCWEQASRPYRKTFRSWLWLW